jgi:hypothetical protein
MVVSGAFEIPHGIHLLYDQKRPIGDLAPWADPVI